MINKDGTQSARKNFIFLIKYSNNLVKMQKKIKNKPLQIFFSPF